MRNDNCVLKVCRQFYFSSTDSLRSLEQLKQVILSVIVHLSPSILGRAAEKERRVRRERKKEGAGCVVRTGGGVKKGGEEDKEEGRKK